MTPRPKAGAIGKTVGKFVSDVLNRLEARTEQNEKMISALDSELVTFKTDMDAFGECLRFALDNYKDTLKAIHARVAKTEALLTPEFIGVLAELKMRNEDLELRMEEAEETISALDSELVTLKTRGLQNEQA